jgi:hypothetical protein
VADAARGAGDKSDAGSEGFGHRRGPFFPSPRLRGEGGALHPQGAG